MPDVSIATRTIGNPIASVNRHGYTLSEYSLGMASRGDRLREARLSNQLSQAELARRIKVSQPTIAAAEAGGGTEHIVKIALETGYSAYWLETGKGPKRMGRLEALHLSDDEQAAAAAYIAVLRNTKGR